MRGAVTRFAPSPTGYLHLGHAGSALFAFEAARAVGGQFLLRIEDIDRDRCRARFDQALREDLSWLGVTWREPVRRQSEHMAEYARALEQLDAMGLLYPCVLSRRELAGVLSAPHDGPGGAVVTGTDRLIAPQERERRLAEGAPYALRLRMEEAMRRTGPLTWHDRRTGRQVARPGLFGDVILARKDIRTSYHLAVTVDDAAQAVSLVTRGDDLFEATHVHRLLQALLDLPVPEYTHHPLIVDDDGRRLAKRDRSLTIRALREDGQDPEAVRGMVVSGGIDLDHAGMQTRTAETFDMETS